MPGAIFMHDQPTYQGTPGQGVPDAVSAGASAGPTSWSVIIWLAVIGVVIPAIMFGGLRAGGFQFVFRGR